MKTKSFWLYLEPYVIINVFNNKALLYNTIDGTKLFFDSKTNKQALDLIILLKEKNSIIEVDSESLKDLQIKSFLHEIRSNHLGDIVNVSSEGRKPFVFQPVLGVQKDKTVLKYNEDIIGHGVLTYINEATFYLNSRLKNSEKLYTDAFKQFPCILSNDSDEELNFELIIEELNSLQNGTLRNVNLFGGNILKYSKLALLTNKLNKMRQIKKYYLHINHFEDAYDFLNSLSENSIAVFIIDKTSYWKNTKSLGNRTEKPKNIRFHIIVRDEDDFKIIDDINKNYPKTNYRVYPYYDGSNIDFFKNNVYLNKEILKTAKPKMDEIFQKMEINSKYFGKLTVLNNGSLYSNLNYPSHGSYEDRPIAKVVQTELTTDKSWYLTRNSVKPCRNCIYNILCPDISNYEIVMNKFNMCTIM